MSRDSEEIKRRKQFFVVVTGDEVCHSEWVFIRLRDVPNYCCEIYQWLGFNIATQTAFGYLFLMAGMSQMFPWAVQKHKRLKKLFDGTNGRKKFKRRFIVLPPFF